MNEPDRNELSLKWKYLTTNSSQYFQEEKTDSPGCLDPDSNVYSSRVKQQQHFRENQGSPRRWEVSGNCITLNKKEKKNGLTQSSLKRQTSFLIIFKERWFLRSVWLFLQILSVHYWNHWNCKIQQKHSFGCLNLSFAGQMKYSVLTCRWMHIVVQVGNRNVSAPSFPGTEVLCDFATKTCSGHWISIQDWSGPFLHRWWSLFLILFALNTWCIFYGPSFQPHFLRMVNNPYPEQGNEMCVLQMTGTDFLLKLSCGNCVGRRTGIVMGKHSSKSGVSDPRPPLTPSAYRDTIPAQTKMRKAMHFRLVFKSTISYYCKLILFCHVHSVRIWH